MRAILANRHARGSDVKKIVARVRRRVSVETGARARGAARQGVRLGARRHECGARSSPAPGARPARSTRPTLRRSTPRSSPTRAHTSTARGSRPTTSRAVGDVADGDRRSSRSRAADLIVVGTPRTWRFLERLLPHSVSSDVSRTGALRRADRPRALMSRRPGRGHPHHLPARLLRRVRRGGGQCATAAIRHVRGDRDHPVSRGRLCVKCATAYNGVLLDPAARLLHPLRRSGPEGQRALRGGLLGGGARPRSPRGWAGSPGETILNAHYTGTFALLGYCFPLRFFNRLGATEVDPDTICNKAGHVALDYLYGTSLDGFDPRTAARRGLRSWCGARTRRRRRPTSTSTGCPRRRARYDRRRPGARRRPRAAADLHLAPFPGSDAALAFALLHVIAREGLLDRRAAGRARASAGTSSSRCSSRLHAGVGRARHRRAGGADRAGRARSTAPARRCCGSGRASSASRAAATRCAPSGCCRR